MRTTTYLSERAVATAPGPAGSLAALLVGATTRKRLLAYMLIAACAVVALVHTPSLSARATYLDDHHFALQNPLVQNPSWESTRRFVVEVWEPSTIPGFYLPLTMISLMVDREMSGRYDSMRTYHRTSLAFHVANTALLGVFLYLLFGRPGVAAGLALLFGLHPLSVESVCWISERKTVLSAFFALWSLIFYLQFAEQRRRRHFAGCCVTYALALLCKPIAVPLPAMMLLLDHWPLKRLSRKAVVEKWPLFTIGVLSAVVIFVSQQLTAPAKLPGDYDPWRIPLVLCHNIVFYLHKFFWPAAMSAYYGFPSPMSLRSPAVLSGVIGTALLVPTLILAHRRTRAPLTGWLIFFVMIFPAMGIISVTPTIAANRYLYLSALGFLMVLAALARWFIDAAPERRRAIRQVVLFVVLVAAAGAETVALRRYQSRWRDTVELHEYLLETEPDAPKLNSSLGVAYAHRGQPDMAVECYRRALASSPDDKVAHYNLALALSRQGPQHTKEVVEHYQKALEADPTLTVAYLNLGNILLATGDCDRAIEQYQEILETRSDFAPAHYKLGMALTFSGKPAKGLKRLREALQVNPSFLLALKDAAWFLATHPDEAIRDPNEALGYAEQAATRSDRRDAGVLDVLAAAYASDAQYAKAVETAQEALTMARRLRRDELATRIEEHLRAYEMERPYIESPRVQFDRLVAKARTEETQAGDGRPEAGDATEDSESETQDSTLDTQN